MAKDRSFLRSVTGSTVHAELAQSAPQPETVRSVSEAPADLPESQRPVWDELYRANAEVVDEQSVPLFRMLVTAVALYRKAADKVSDIGSVIKSPSGYPIQNPYVADMNKQAATIISVSRELGITPASRARANGKNSPKSKRKNNPFGDLRSL